MTQWLPALLTNERVQGRRETARNWPEAKVGLLSFNDGIDSNLDVCVFLSSKKSTILIRFFRRRNRHESPTREFPRLCSTKLFPTSSESNSLKTDSLISSFISKGRSIVEFPAVFTYRGCKKKGGSVQRKVIFLSTYLIFSSHGAISLSLSSTVSLYHLLSVITPRSFSLSKSTRSFISLLLHSWHPRELSNALWISPYATYQAQDVLRPRFSS